MIPLPASIFPMIRAILFTTATYIHILFYFYLGYYLSTTLYFIVIDVETDWKLGRKTVTQHQSIADAGFGNDLTDYTMSNNINPIVIQYY